MELRVPNLCAVWSVCLYVTTFLFSIDLFQHTTAVNAVGNETDRFALLKFKEAIATDPNGFLNSWNGSFNFCNWRGVTCSRRHQRVTALELPDSDLHGTLSPYIGNLSFLRFINLQNNSFSGKIPKQINHLFRLQYLNLTFNKLEGTIPVNLTNPELSIISFRSNRLGGKIPLELGSLKKLVYLNLAENNLTGGIPPSLGNLSSIIRLSLSYNNLVGTLPEELGRLRYLILFSVNTNNLSGMIHPSLFNLSSMITFSISQNKFNGTIAPEIGLQMPNLQIAIVGGNEFSGQIPSSFSNCSQLQRIDVQRNRFVGQIPKIFGDLPHLLFLDVSGNSLGSNSDIDLSFITSLTNCSKLGILDLNSNNFGGVLPNSLANLSSQLHIFYIGNNQVSGTIPAALENLHNLIALGLNSNLFTGVIPSFFGKFQKLQLLSLYNNSLSGRIPHAIGNLTQLYGLYLSANKFEGSIPASIGNCQNLQELELAQNRLSGEIPPEVIGLSSIALLLNLSQNSLTGSLPLEVGKLKTVNTVDISENKLTGDIPEIIGECQEIQFLFLQGNLFQGSIPSSLASVKNLEYVDLSRNNLSGQIPKDLQTLPFLLYLNLSFNNLEGEVPKEGVFRSTGGAVSLVGNAELCGGIYELQLPACPIKRKSHGHKLKIILPVVAGCSLLSVFLFSLYWRGGKKNKPLSAVSSINFLSRVSYQTLHQATDGFSSSNLIGSGGFGSVYKGILDLEGNRVVAIKVLNLQQRGASKSFTAECNALRNIRHRNLVKILSCCSSTDYSGNEFKALVFDFLSNGSLEEWLHRENQSRSLNLLQRLNIAVDVASALCYLHDHCDPQIIHCDMKPSNILLDDDMVAHVGDFGLARLISTTTGSSQNQSSTVGIKGTIGYAPPEYALGVEPYKQGDVYSYGILLLQLFTGRVPTDKIFEDGYNIHTFVKTAIPERLVQIVDPTLLATLEAITTPATTENGMRYISGCKIQKEAEEDNIDYESLSKMNIYVWKFILPILKIGLACSEESPRCRMSMKDVLRDLHHIQLNA